MGAVINTEKMSRAGEAFSRQAKDFDTIDDQSKIIKWMREHVYTHLKGLLPKPSYILELNAGTGIDACHMASLGHRVLATDISAKMLEQAQKKVLDRNLKDKVNLRQCSYTDLQTINESGFDLIFSNFGGLNCLDDLSKMTSEVPRLLKPGGQLVLVMITPFCIWETLTALKGNFKLAFRRFKKNGAPSNLEGVDFTTYYYWPREIKQSLGKDFKITNIQGLATFTPPPYFEDHFKRRPALLNRLFRLDAGTSSWPILRLSGDHYIVTIQYHPKQDL